MRRRIRDHGHRLAHLLVEKAVPGTVAGDERPEPATAPPWVEEKKVRGVVAPNLDRLARARELVVQEATLAQCWKPGG
ncbi:resolvase, partial [Streptomyces sp. 2MCAF27]